MQNLVIIMRKTWRIFLIEAFLMTLKMTVKDIFNAVGNKTVFIPFSVSVNKEEVINYINAGFSIAFMKAGEFKKMQKAYKEYV